LLFNCLYFLFAAKYIESLSIIKYHSLTISQNILFDRKGNAFIKLKKVNRLKMNIFLLLAVLLSLTVVKVNGQPSLFSVTNFRNFNNYDVNVATSILNSFIAINNLACVYACIYNSDCSLVVFKSSGNVCNVYSSSAVAQVITTSSSCTLYQKQINLYNFPLIRAR
jgi:hypothetical protein